MSARPTAATSSPPPGRSDDPPSVPVPALLTARKTEGPSGGDVLYRIYLVALFGGVYGYILAQTLMRGLQPDLSVLEVAFIGAGALVTPFVTTLVGLRFGRWAGPVAVSRPEAALVLPSLVDRRPLLLPRLRRSFVAVSIGGAVVALVVLVLVALHRSLTGPVWVIVPLLGSASSLLGAACSALAQTEPDETASLRRGRQVTWLLSIAVVATLLVDEGRRVLRWVGEAVGVVTGAAGAAGTTVLVPAGALIAVAAAAAFVVVAARRAVLTAHHEQYESRAGVHDGLSASVRLGDLRSLTLASEPTWRARHLRSVRHPRRPAGAVLWRHLTALRTRPVAALRCAAGWAIASAILAAPGATPGFIGATVRGVVLVVALYLGVSALVEPFRREHDTPLAAELLPFGFVQLTWLHLRAAFLVATPIGLVTVTLTWAVLAGAAPPLAVTAAVPFVAATAVLATADRVRQPSNVGDILVALPAGSAPEVMSIALTAALAWPVFAMFPVLLPAVISLTAPGWEMDAALLVPIAAAAGAVALAFRALGFLIWTREYERTLQDAELLQNPSGISAVWFRWRAQRAARRRGEVQVPL